MNEHATLLENLERSLEEASKYDTEGAQIWNAYGLNFPKLRREAALHALARYERSLRVLEAIDLNLLPTKLQSVVCWNLELARASIAEARANSLDEWNPVHLQKIVELDKATIEHKQKALEHLRATGLNDDDQQFTLQNQILFAKANNAFMSARLSSRQKNIDKALDLYREGREHFAAIIARYEAITPLLKNIREEVEKTLERLREDILQAKDNLTEGIRWTACSFRFDDEPTGSPFEDLYRRACANYYSAIATISNLEGYMIAKNGGNREMIDGKLAESIAYTYRAMEVFPDNLEYHRDLFNAWMERGRMFGCPILDFNNYYHVECPLAIMYWIGAWYVSPTFEYESLSCTVCGKDALECPHLPGEEVNGVKVQYSRRNLVQKSLSLVHTPEDPRCRIQYISIPRSYVSNPSQMFRTRCRFCSPDLLQDTNHGSLIDLPEFAQEEIERRYRQIIQSRKVDYIDLEQKDDPIDLG